MRRARMHTLHARAPHTLPPARATGQGPACLGTVVLTLRAFVWPRAARPRPQGTRELRFDISLERSEPWAAFSRGPIRYLTREIG